jgi:hypothetical protein
MQVSTCVLVGPDAGDDSAVDATQLLAEGLARCVFGGLLLPAAYEDVWVLEGLGAHLCDVWTAAWLGKVRCGCGCGCGCTCWVLPSRVSVGIETAAAHLIESDAARGIVLLRSAHFPASDA